MIKQNIAKLLDTEMERKDFLKLVGLGVIAATGVTQILKTLTQTQSAKHSSSGPVSLSYGATTYGGK